MNVDKMKAGREMNVQVAEKVMEWNQEQLHLTLVPASKEQALEWGWEEYTEETRDWHKTFNIRTLAEPISLHYPEGWSFNKLPRYSTDIAASFEVDKPEWRWTFKEDPQRLTVLLWPQPEEPIIDATVTLDTGPIATAYVEWDEVGTKAQAYALGRCRAALKTVEVSNADD